MASSEPKNADRAFSLQAVARRAIERTVVHRPNGGLGSVVNLNFGKDRLDMNLHRRFGDVCLTRDDLVGIAFHQIVQDALFLRGQVWSAGALGYCRRRDRLDPETGQPSCPPNRERTRAFPPPPETLQQDNSSHGPALTRPTRRLGCRYYAR
jgi:hypothetical protein